MINTVCNSILQCLGTITCNHAKHKNSNLKINFSFKISAQLGLKHNFNQSLYVIKLQNGQRRLKLICFMLPVGTENCKVIIIQFAYVTAMKRTNAFLKFEQLSRWLKSFHAIERVQQC